MPDTVTMMDSEGQAYHVPQENMKAAQAEGLKPAVMMTSPEGEAHWVPRSNAARAIKEHGFTVGQPTTSDKPQKTDWSVKGVREAYAANADSMAQAADRATNEALGPESEGKSYLSKLYAQGKALAASSAQVANKTASGATEPKNLAIAALGLIDPAIPAAAFMTQGAGSLLGLTDGVNAGDTSPENVQNALLNGATVVGGAAGSAAPKAGEAIPAVVKGAKAVGREALNRAPGVGATAGAAIGAKVAGTPGAIVGGAAGKLVGDAVKARFPQYETPAPPKSAPTQAEDAAPSQADSAPAAHPDAAQFEQIYKVPLDNYIDESGKFNTKDFLDEVVKPKTEPPNAVITRTFGSDGVDLVNKLNGKPLAKWESSAPEGEAKGGSARLRAKEILKGDRGEAGAPGTISEYQGRVATAEKTGEVSARGFLKKVGADESSVLNGAGRTPMEHADSVIYHREQIRAGKSTPVELHVDESGNVIGGDGRHRAMAAIQEHGPNAKIKIKIMKHSFQGVD